MCSHFARISLKKVGNDLAAFCHAKKRVLATMLSGETDLK
jgi:hypothetical protein